MNAAEHKAQAELLLVELGMRRGETWRDDPSTTRMLLRAQIHATLATIPDVPAWPTYAPRREQWAEERPGFDSATGLRRCCDTVPGSDHVAGCAR